MQNFRCLLIALPGFLPLLLPANQALLLEDEVEALRIRMELIDQAQEEILLSYYIFNEDPVGLSLLDRLIKAVREKEVRVQLLLDRKTQGLSREMLTFIQASGIEVREFGPGTAPGIGYFTRRLHDKIFLVDQTYLITGGRNIKETYYYKAKEPVFLDREILLIGGQAVREAREYFLQCWKTEELVHPARTDTKPLAPQDLDWLQARLSAGVADLSRLLPELFLRKRPSEQGRYTSFTASAFFHDRFERQNGGYHKKVRDCTDSLLSAVSRASRSVIITNPYFNPTRRWMEVLEDALKRGVQIRLLTNSLMTNDVTLMQSAYLNKRRKLLKMGLEIWEYRGTRNLHAKTFIIDDRVNIVGSYNIHTLSEKYNTEVALLVVDEGLARQQLQAFDNDLRDAWPVSLEGWNEKERKTIRRQTPGWTRIKNSLNRVSLAWMLEWII